MRFVSICLAALWCSGFATLVQAKDLVIFTPSSLTDVMSSIAQNYEAESGQKVLISVAATSVLARQIEAGAKADIFISADQRWIDWLNQKQLLEAQSLKPIAANTLVVAVRREVENWASAEMLLTSERFAMAEPASVPAGRYAREALAHLGWWERAKRNAIYGENVRVALKRVARGDVGAAIVYGSDVVADKTVRTLFEFPPKSHRPITAWAGIVGASQNKVSAGKFLDYLGGTKTVAIFAEYGFWPPQKENLKRQ